MNECLAGNLGPPKFCAKSPCGRLGTCCNFFPFLEKYRQQILLFIFVVNVATFIPAIMALFAAARGKQLVLVNWANLDANLKNGEPDGHLYVGFYGVYERGGFAGRTFLSWNELKDYVPPGKKDNLSSCKHSAKDVISTAAMGLFTILPSLAAIWTRKYFDNGCNKFVGVLSGVAGGISSISSLATFRNACYRNLPTTFYSDGVNIGSADKSLGPGFTCEIVVIIVCIFTGLVHLILPVPPNSDPLIAGDNSRDDSGADDKL